MTLFLEFLEEIFFHSFLDLLKLLPFLFLSYLLMEAIEHKAGERMQNSIRRAGKAGPLLGSLLGVVPQCGFSAAAAGLYAGRVISLGTLMAVYLSTSDEMLPILIAEGAPVATVLKILGIKFVLGMLYGFLIDLVLHLVRKSNGQDQHITDLCEVEGCHCEKGILRSALHHTLHIALFLYIVLAALAAVIFFVGEDRLSLVFSSLPVVGQLLSALIGLIPSCASSVLITKLFLDGVISAGCMLSGLLVGAGVGVLVLFRMNQSKKESFFILLLLFALGSVTGMLADLFNLGAFLA